VTHTFKVTSGTIKLKDKKISNSAKTATLYFAKFFSFVFLWGYNKIMEVFNLFRAYIALSPIE
jgi:hypothetical protein